MRIFVLCGLMAVLPCAAQDLREWLNDIAQQQLRVRREKVSALKTRAEAEARAAWVRRTLLQSMGGLPSERTPLNARRTGTIDHGDYRVDNVVYESQPRFFVTANLYIPKGAGPFPAILQPTGHSQSAKARYIYQTLALGLVKNGFVVLTYDPLGQGERRIFFDRDLGDSRAGGTVVEHQMVGIQSLLAGESVARYMVWDGIRSLDYLESLPQVDRTKLAVAGCSGGGTLTAYLAVLDPRLQAAAPACYITSWEEQLLGTGPQDAEQQFPDQLLNGMTHADFVAAFAPRPYLVASTEGDYFSIGGARAAVAENKHVYELYDARVKVDHVVGPGGHGMPPVVREGIYGWMHRWLRGGPAGPLPEPSLQTVPEDDLNVTDTGQVSTSLGGETASTLNIRRFAELRPARPAIQDLASWQKQVRTKLQELTRYRTPSKSTETKVLSIALREAYQLRTIRLEAFDGRQVPGLLAVPDNVTGPPILLISDAGSAAQFRSGADGVALARSGRPVLSLDIAGFGATNTRWASYSDAWFGPDKLAWLALMIGRPLVGLGIEDILLGIDALAREGWRDPAGISDGIVGVAMLHAAVVDSRLSSLVLQGLPVSYHDIAISSLNRQVIAAVLPDVLRAYDLPDLAACVAPRPVALLNARTPAGPRALLPAVRQAWTFALEAYAASGNTASLNIGLRREDSAVDSLLP